MKTREEAIAFCKRFPEVYEDYPFHDQNWTVMRYEKNRKSFAFIYERQGACLLYTSGHRGDPLASANAGKKGRAAGIL